MSGIGEFRITQEQVDSLAVPYEEYLALVNEAYGLRLSRFTRELLAAGLRGQKSIIEPAERRYVRLYWEPARRIYVIQRRDYVTPWPVLPEGADLLTLW